MAPRTKNEASRRRLRGVLFVGVVLLGGCVEVPVREMTVSPADSRARRVYVEAGDAERRREETGGGDLGGGGAAAGTAGDAYGGEAMAPVVPRAPEPSPPPVEAVDDAESYGPSEGEEESPTGMDADVAVVEPAVAEEVYRTEATSDPHSRSVDTLAGVSGSTTAVITPVLNIGAYVPFEPLPWVPLDPAPLPAGPRRVLLASLELPPGTAVLPPSSSCQDVLLYVGDGELEAIGTGIGTTDSPATLYAGDAVRFGPEGDARIENVGTAPVHAVIAIARREGTGAPLYTAPDEAARCPELTAPDPLVLPMRVAHVATAAPLVVLDGHLEVRILLDADGSGAMHAGLAVLRGDAEARVAPHVHDTSAELLFIEDGEGTMHLGDRDVAVHPGMVVYVPEGMEHSFDPSGARPLVALQVYAPSGPEQRFRGLAHTP